ncbi:phage distal tail protein, Rcc01695 family [Ruegeria sp. MALMAid1280]|uniref:phage distal tail protein, Rcc01695 family n=1 Tax=Ruegeria sp. MALMAid1280 TaxID=3411634 RepID=UPI003B9E2DAE
MNFHEVRFPASLSFGSVGGPERRTDIVTLANGFEERNTPWAHSRRRYDAGLGMRSLDDIETLVSFFEARQGQMFGFRWKDWSDYKSGAATADVAQDNQVIARGDGTATEFQLVKTYSSGGFSYVRPIVKPVLGTVKIGLEQDQMREGVDFEVDLATGRIVFYAPPPEQVEITAGFEFDVPVRFDTDRIQTSVASFQAGDVPNVPVVEVRV